jgi:23S rRNA pseudouridine1911/1915/1917 synthase
MANDEQIIEFQVETSGERLDKLIVEQAEALALDLSRVRIQAMIKDGFVTVNGAVVKPGIKLRGGELVRATVPAVPEAETQPEKIDLTVVYEDDDIAVIEKSAGMVVHPGTGNNTGTLVNALLARYPKLAEMRNTDGRQGIVHRLDKDTSGLMVIALTDHARLNLIHQFQE